MKRSIKKLVLVTGVPRSGTTPIGSILALAPGCRELYEPLSPIVGLTAVTNWYEIQGTESLSDQLLDRIVEQIRSLELELKDSIHERGSPIWQAVKRLTYGSRTKFSARLCQFDPRLKTIIWKDPNACLLAERVARVHGVPVIIACRPPLAVAASFKRLQWGAGALDVAERLAELGFDFSTEIEAVKGDADEPAIQGTLLWHFVYTVLLDWHRKGAKFLFVDLNSILLDPVESYRKLYAFAGLTWTPQIESTIATRYRSGSNRPDVPKSGKQHDRSRNLEAVNTYWTDLLDEREVAACSDLNSALWEDLKTAVHGSQTDSVLPSRLSQSHLGA